MSSEYRKYCKRCRAEHLGIPENDDWKCLIKLPSGELQKICRDLKEFGDSINISATKDGLKSRRAEGWGYRDLD